MTFSRFLERFPDNDACLEYLKQRYYPNGHECPKCHKATKYHRVRGRAAYSCQYCGHHVYPTAGTIFHKSTTSLVLWFWAIFLISSTRCGISAKQLEREIGVTYKTAWRMFRQIRTLMDDNDGPPLDGKVEIDETLVGGKPRARESRHGKGRLRNSYKPIVLGLVERGGRVQTTIIPNRGGPAMAMEIRKRVLPSSMIFTDEWHLYGVVGREYMAHRRIKHQAHIYVDGDTHTNTVEGFFGLVKTGIRGVYHSVSAKYLQTYFNEYAFRYNRRIGSSGYEPIFWAILDRVQKKAALASS
jgi:transposase